jgi:hypothetical protein
MKTLIEKKVSHTPGPWKVYRLFNSPLKDPNDGTEHLSHEIHGPDNTYLASAYYCNNTDEKKIGRLRPLYRWEMEANAKLIAAAPELLEALQALVMQVQKDCSMSSDPKYFDLLQKCQNAMQAIQTATE